MLLVGAALYKFVLKLKNKEGLICLRISKNTYLYEHLKTFGRIIHKNSGAAKQVLKTLLRLVIMNTEKICKKCEQVKSVLSFSKSKKLPDGLQAHCKVCAKTYADRYRDEKKVKNESYKKAFGKHYKANHSEADHWLDNLSGILKGPKEYDFFESYWW